MRSIITGSIVLVFASLFFACKKNNGAESDLYGTWVKGSSTGDTLWFMKKDGKHIVRVPESFNPQMPLYSEIEYRLNNGALSIKSFAPTYQVYFNISSFIWTDQGKEFTVQSTQLFIFSSFSGTYKYKKI